MKPYCDLKKSESISLSLYKESFKKKRVYGTTNGAIGFLKITHFWANNFHAIRDGQYRTQFFFTVGIVPGGNRIPFVRYLQRFDTSRSLLKSPIKQLRNTQISIMVKHFANGPLESVSRYPTSVSRYPTSCESEAMASPSACRER